jgi:hypothetical protein
MQALSLRPRADSNAAQPVASPCGGSPGSPGVPAHLRVRTVSRLGGAAASGGAAAESGGRDGAAASPHGPSPRERNAFFSADPPPQPPPLDLNGGLGAQPPPPPSTLPRRSGMRRSSLGGPDAPKPRAGVSFAASIEVRRAGTAVIGAAQEGSGRDARLRGLLAPRLTPRRRAGRFGLRRLSQARPSQPIRRRGGCSGRRGRGRAAGARGYCLRAACALAHTGLTTHAIGELTTACLVTRRRAAQAWSSAHRVPLCSAGCAARWPRHRAFSSRVPCVASPCASGRQRERRRYRVRAPRMSCRNAPQARVRRRRCAPAPPPSAAPSH